MNLRRLRSLFTRTSTDAKRLGGGVLALANVGTTQSHAAEVASEKLLEIAEDTRPTSAVFWHRQSHARAFDASGELIAPLYLHWFGDRALITATLTSLFDGQDVRFTPASSDDAAFIVSPLEGVSAAAPVDAPPKRPAKKKTASEGAPSFQVTGLKDTPETEAMLVDAVATRSGKDALDALQVLLRFGQKREEKLVERHRKAGTLDAFYASPPPGPYPAGAIDALARNAAAVAGAVTEARESAFRVALEQARRAAHPGLAATLDAITEAAPWRARRAAAELCSRNAVGAEAVRPFVERMFGAPEAEVVAAAVASAATLRSVSRPTVMLDLLDANALAPAPRAYVLRDIAYSTLTDDERARATAYADDAALEGAAREAFRRSVAR